MQQTFTVKQGQLKGLVVTTRVQTSFRLWMESFRIGGTADSDKSDSKDNNVIMAVI
jgi:hypothetical protein